MSATYFDRLEQKIWTTSVDNDHTIRQVSSNHVYRCTRRCFHSDGLPGKNPEGRQTVKCSFHFWRPGRALEQKIWITSVDNDRTIEKVSTRHYELYKRRRSHSNGCAARPIYILKN